MKKVWEFVRPNVFNLSFTFLVLGWQYFYSYAGSQIEIMGIFRNYTSVALNLVHWDNLLVRGVSLGAIWLFVAFFIFLSLLVIEVVTVYLHNKKIEKKFLNRPKEDFSHLLRARELDLKRHFPAQLLFSGALIIIIFTFVSGVDAMEKWRFSVLDSYFLAAQGAEKTIDFNASIPQVASFLLLIPVWYFEATIISFLFRQSRKLRQEEKLTEEHCGAIIEDFAG